MLRDQATPTSLLTLLLVSGSSYYIIESVYIIVTTSYNSIYVRLN